MCIEVVQPTTGSAYLVDESLCLVIDSAKKAMDTPRIHVKADVARLNRIQCGGTHLCLI